MRRDIEKMTYQNQMKLAENNFKRPNVESHPEEYIDEHIEKLQEFRFYITKSLHDYLAYADLLTKECDRRYVVFLRVMNWFIKYLEGQVAKST